MSGRTILVGDVHGCLEELQLLLRKLRFHPDCDRLVLIGDVVDKGPDSFGVIRLIQGLGADCVLGDHEHAYVQHLKHGAPLSGAQQAFCDELADDDVSWLLSLPAYLELGVWDREPYYAVHGGFEPGLLQTSYGLGGFRDASITEQRVEVLPHLRWVSPHGLRAKGAGFFINSSGATVWRTPKTAVRWTQAWSGGGVVFSHSTRASTSVQFDNGCFCIDTGCVYGGRLSALILAEDGDHDVVQVQSQRYVVPLSAAA